MVPMYLSFDIVKYFQVAFIFLNQNLKCVAYITFAKVTVSHKNQPKQV